MAHPAKPDNHEELREMLDRLEDDSFEGWHGEDRPVVDCEDKSLDEALSELGRRVEDRLDEYEERQEFTKPSRKRREAREKAEYRIQKDRTRTW